MESYLSAISPDRFILLQNFWFSNFYDFSFIFVNRGPCGRQNFKHNATSPTLLNLFQPSYMTSVIVMGNIAYYVFGNLPKIKNFMAL